MHSPLNRQLSRPSLFRARLEDVLRLAKWLKIDVRRKSFETDAEYKAKVVTAIQRWENAYSVFGPDSSSS